MAHRSGVWHLVRGRTGTRRRPLASLPDGGYAWGGAPIGEPAPPSPRERHLDTTTALLLIIVAAAVGIVGSIVIMRRQRRALEALRRESPFAVATEGMKRCPSCGIGNLVTADTCSACGKPLPV